MDKMYSARQSVQSSQGFTIVELLIVIIIIGILAAITIVSYNGITTKANQAAAVANATQAARKVIIYYTGSGSMPANMAAAGITDTAGLQYTASSSSDSFCITATTSNQSASAGGVSGSANATVSGPCPGHTGSVPGSNGSNRLSSGKTCPPGYIVVPGNSVYGTNDFCVMKYEAKNVGGVATSQVATTPWVSITQSSAIAKSIAACASCHLLTEAEWMTLAANVSNVPSNWSGGAVGSGYIYSGHNDNAPANALAADSIDSNGYAGETNTGGNQRRTLTLTNGQVIWDMAGNVWEWTGGTITGNQPGASGYNWQQYTSIADFRGLATASRPGSIPVSGQNTATWDSTQGIGHIYSNVDETVTRAFLRGGYWNNGTHAGILALSLNYAPSDSYTTVGFRVASSGN